MLIRGAQPVLHTQPLPGPLFLRNGIPQPPYTPTHIPTRGTHKRTATMIHNQALLPTCLKGVGGWCDPALEPPKTAALPTSERRDNSDAARLTSRRPQTQPQQLQQQRQQRHQTERAKSRGVTGGTLARAPSPPASRKAATAAATTSKSATAKPRRRQFNAPPILAAQLLRPRSWHTELEGRVRSPAAATTTAFKATPLLASPAR